MPSHLSADRPAAQPPGRGSVDALISQTRRLKGDVDAVRRDARSDGSDPRERWQRALYDLALHQLQDLDTHLAQLQEGPPPDAAPGLDPGPAAPPPEGLLSRVGSAEWNLLTDEATWSGELYRILGRSPATPPLTLDELPSLVLDEDRPKLAAMVTDCLIDAKPIDGEFRIVRPDGGTRTVHMMGEPVLDADGGTTSMWAVLRDVSELRRSRRAVTEMCDSLRGHRHRTRTEQGVAAEFQEAVPPPRHGSLRIPRPGPGALDLAAHYLPASTDTPTGGDWYDALEVTGGETLLSVGDLAGHGPAATSNTASLLGAVRGMAMTGTQPGPLMALLNQLLDATAQPTLGSALCCRYRPATRTLVWAQAGHPGPLLFRGGTGRRLEAPDGVLLGATPGASYGQAEVLLRPGDLLLLHTDGLVPRHGPATAGPRLLDLAPRLAGARTAQDCVRVVVEEFGTGEREDDACVLAARVTP
ncbi:MULTISPECIES: PP2C family protein-serine/threonine phosphatase [unclassified Streptomyces]|uniref:PP2C family protein-serine/threonine phosphatase n=1 Tax=unclassified Streptomyces TaxID=2593676 RepID=UPI001F0454E8|nr:MULTISPECIES: SpoIIE family protein phosphatase [unclassified Streptomyces]MCH0565757.1 SpoIIE family protein phosphatase [Streptomyces sp. MUM 2J]MCH0571012.1 SpoIIE family protein phosphatase [Streptomyces sp. MUM 136J]